MCAHTTLGGCNVYILRLHFVCVVFNPGVRGARPTTSHVTVRDKSRHSDTLGEPYIYIETNNPVCVVFRFASNLVPCTHSSDCNDIIQTLQVANYHTLVLVPKLHLAQL